MELILDVSVTHIKNNQPLLHCPQLFHGVFRAGICGILCVNIYDLSSDLRQRNLPKADAMMRVLCGRFTSSVIITDCVRSLR